MEEDGEDQTMQDLDMKRLLAVYIIIDEPPMHLDQRSVLMSARRSRLIRRLLVTAATLAVLAAAATVLLGGLRPAGSGRV
ncbi:hypothetical protein ACWKSP_35910 [Micromonosporaceae bacterium Da 78-11]